jgi:hypothetical protein
MLNKKDFLDPGLSLTSQQTFGVITGATGPRAIQLGFRVEF